MTDVTKTLLNGPRGNRPAVDAFVDGAPHLGDAAIETFRTLALGVQHLMPPASPWAIAVLGAPPDPRRLVVSEMLGRALSELRPPVRLVEADPGSPLRPVEVHADVPSFSVIPVARLEAPGPATVLGAVRQTIADELRQGCTVVVDAPATSESSLAFSIAQSVDAVVYVAQVGRSASASHVLVREQLDLLGVRVLGVVVEQG